MASRAPGQCCVSGFRHEGVPTGAMVRVAGRWDSYVASPSQDQGRKDVAILFIPDVIGIWNNSKLLADQFADSGYLCMVLDIFNGDAIEFSKMTGTDMERWVKQGSDGQNPHTVEAIDPIVIAAIRTLKENYGAQRVGSMGYCFGAKYAVRHYKSGIDVACLAHPSFVSDEELAAITGPLSIAAAETDPIFPQEDRYRSEDILRKTGQSYQICLYSGVSHGFAVRGDISKRDQRFAKEKSFQQAVTWFHTHL